MTQFADHMLDRLHLKRSLHFWRIAAVILLVLALLAAISPDDLHGAKGEHIARFAVEGVIKDDPKRDEFLKELAENDDVKAVFIVIDSPGGTAVGGEQLYLSVKALAEAKPVVAIMRSMATSAAYMTALGTDHIIARRGTVTGSIGVIAQMVDATELAGKIGLKPYQFKSGDLKASPSPLEPLSPEAEKMMKEIIDSFFAYFKTIVVEERELDASQLALVESGQIFTGAQAREIGLIDALGGEREARAWLSETYQLSNDLPVEEVRVPKSPFEWAEGKASSLAEAMLPAESVMQSHPGLWAIWYPHLM